MAKHSYLVQAAYALVDTQLSVVDLCMSGEFGRMQLSNILTLAGEICRRRTVRPRQRRALELLRSFLTDSQRAELKARGCFMVTGSAGGEYRLWPSIARVERTQRHGKRIYGAPWYCIHHTAEEWVPPADDTLSQLLLLRADEPGFLTEAHANHVLYANGGWDPEWQRRRREIRRGLVA